jgi:hypothetical protein
MAFCSTNADMLVSYQGIAKETISNLIALFAITAGTFPRPKLAAPVKSEQNGSNARKTRRLLKNIRALEGFISVHIRRSLVS